VSERVVMLEVDNNFLWYDERTEIVDRLGFRKVQPFMLRRRCGEYDRTMPPLPEFRPSLHLKTPS
jgi:hypothetical protein